MKRKVTFFLLLTLFAALLLICLSHVRKTKNNNTDKEYSLEQIINTYEPALIRIAHYYRNESEPLLGSGFIINISNKNIIICTNAHVINDASESEIYFYNGEMFTGNTIAVDTTKDIAFISVDSSHLSSSLSDTLVAVPLDAHYWNKLDDEKEIPIIYKALKTNGKLWRKERGILLSKQTTFEDNGIVYNMAQVSTPFARGVSGSAIIDNHGKLIGMATLIKLEPDNTETYWCVTTPDILDFYNKTFSKKN